MCNKRMFTKYVRVAWFLCLAIYVFISAFIFGSISYPMRMIGKTLHILPAKVYGERHKVQIFTFNHPSHLDKFVLFQVFGDYCAIARDMSHTFPAFNFVMNRIGCILVPKDKRRLNTTQKVLEYLPSTTRPFLIATSSGIVSDANIPLKLPTIAFRLQRRVQPIVIVYEGIASDMLPNTLPKCLPYVMNPPRAVQPHVFFLPSLDPSTFASAEQCAAYVRNQMMYVISYTRIKTVANESNT